MKPIKELTQEIKALGASGARFVSLTYTAKGTGEIARHTICLGVSLEKAYKRDLALLLKKQATLSGAALEACNELIASLQESLEKGIGNNSAYTAKDCYETISAGMKLHLEKGELHIYGFALSKVVLQKGEDKKPVKSSEKTIAKNVLRRGMKTGKFRQFALSGLDICKVNGKSIELA